MSMTMRKHLAAAMLLAAVAPLPAVAQQRQSGDTFNWSGTIPQGRWIRIRNLNGEITVGQSTSGRVEVVATKHWRRGDPDVVRIETRKFGPGGESVLICALWGERAECDE